MDLPDDNFTAEARERVDMVSYLFIPFTKLNTSCWMLVYLCIYKDSSGVGHCFARVDIVDVSLAIEWVAAE